MSSVRQLLQQIENVKLATLPDAPKEDDLTTTNQSADPFGAEESKNG